VKSAEGGTLITAQAAFSGQAHTVVKAAYSIPLASAPGDKYEFQSWAREVEQRRTFPYGFGWQLDDWPGRSNDILRRSDRSFADSRHSVSL
jgi:hypothetical protein